LGLALDEPDFHEVPVNIEGLDVLITDGVKPFAEDSLVDFVKNSYSEGFTISSNNC
jgi:Fe-S cluster assembly iron-binding protein IscA